VHAQHHGPIGRPLIEVVDTKGPAHSINSVLIVDVDVVGGERIAVKVGESLVGCAK